MIAVDTNILVHAHRKDSARHAAARRTIATLIEAREPWAIPWPCIHEFVAVVTRTRGFIDPTPVSRAVDQVRLWLSSPGVLTLEETDAHWEVFASILLRARAVGGIVHDARIAAICVEHRVREFWTADRDFSRFPELVTFNPLSDDELHDHRPSYAAVLRARKAGRRRALARMAAR